MRICGESGKVLYDDQGDPAHAYVCAACGKRFSNDRRATGHLAVCPVRMVQKLATEKAIRTKHGTYFITREPSVNLAGIDEIDDEKE